MEIPQLTTLLITDLAGGGPIRVPLKVFLEGFYLRL